MRPATTKPTTNWPTYLHLWHQYKVNRTYLMVCEPQLRPAEWSGPLTSPLRRPPPYGEVIMWATKACMISFPVSLIAIIPCSVAPSCAHVGLFDVWGQGQSCRSTRHGGYCKNMERRRRAFKAKGTWSIFQVQSEMVKQPALPPCFIGVEVSLVLPEL